MTLPKFIICMDGTFRLGMVNQHKHLLKPSERLRVGATAGMGDGTSGIQCIGGGKSAELQVFIPASSNYQLPRDVDGMMLI